MKILVLEMCITHIENILEYFPALSSSKVEKESIISKRALQGTKHSEG